MRNSCSEASPGRAPGRCVLSESEGQEEARAGPADRTRPGQKNRTEGFANPSVGFCSERGHRLSPQLTSHGAPESKCSLRARVLGNNIESFK